LVRSPVPVQLLGAVTPVTLLLGSLVTVTVLVAGLTVAPKHSFTVAAAETIALSAGVELTRPNVVAFATVVIRPKVVAVATPRTSRRVTTRRRSIELPPGGIRNARPIAWA